MTEGGEGCAGGGGEGRKVWGDGECKGRCVGDGCKKKDYEGANRAHGVIFVVSTERRVEAVELGT